MPTNGNATGASLRSTSPGITRLVMTSTPLRGKAESSCSMRALSRSLYRYSTKTRDELLDLLNSLKERLWVPHQAAVEYERNRLSVIGQQHAAYGRTLSAFAKSIGAIRAEFSQLTRHPLLDQEELGRLTDEYEERVTRAVEDTQEQHPTVGETQEELMSDPTLGPHLRNCSADELAVRTQTKMGRLQRRKPDDGSPLNSLRATSMPKRENQTALVTTSSGVRQWIAHSRLMFR